jgi:hypothetical protein
MTSPDDIRRSYDDLLDEMDRIVGDQQKQPEK